jgi:hypothetical protein
MIDGSYLGFLDGGDRTMVLSQQNSPSVSCSDYDSGETASPETPAILTPPVDRGFESFTTSLVPTLLITNLPSVIFSQATDLHPLLCPFGDIVQLKMLSRPADTDTLSVTVEYKTLHQAQEARDSLNRQLYAARYLNAEFLLPEPASPASSEFSALSVPTGDSKPGLNPFAAPFQVQTSMFSGSERIGSLRYPAQSFFSSDEELAASRHWSGHSTPLLALPSLQSQVRSGSGLLVPSVATFRPHSAPSECVS